MSLSLKLTKKILFKTIYLTVTMAVIGSLSTCHIKDRTETNTPARQADLLDLEAWHFEQRLRHFDPSVRCSGIGGSTISCSGYRIDELDVEHLFDEYQNQSGKSWLKLNIQGGPFQ